MAFVFSKNNPLKVIYVKKEWGNGFTVMLDITFWGTQDEEKYKGPEHVEGWQYPRFVYK